MIADKDGAVLFCRHGNRRIVRNGKDRKISVLVDRFEGKWLNSPNDLAYKLPHASLYFTDPPYGLPKQDDPQKELRFNGVFRLAGGELQAVIRDLARPKGIAVSPYGKILYVAKRNQIKTST